jgi:transposase
MTRRQAKRRSDEALTEARKTAVRMRAEGHTAKAIGKILEVHPNTVYRWDTQARDGGESALQVQRRGRRKGEKRRLNLEQEIALRETICQQTPDAVGLPFALWTRQAVQRLIAKETKVMLPIRTVGLYLGRWGLTPQKPLKKPYEQDPRAVTRWLQAEYPAIAARARTEHAGGAKTGEEASVESHLQHHESGADALYDLREHVDGEGPDRLHEPFDSGSAEEDFLDPG